MYARMGERKEEHHIVFILWRNISRRNYYTAT